jgi:carbamoyltransferase
MLIMSIYPLPLVAFSHDASVAVVNESGVVFAYEEEKVSRRLHAIATPPQYSAMMAMKSLGLQPSDIQYLVITGADRCNQRASFRESLSFLKNLLLLPHDVAVTYTPHHLAHSALSTLTSPFDKCLFLTLDAGGDGIMGHWGVFDSSEFVVMERLTLSPAVIFSYMTSLAGFSLFDSGKLMGLSAYGQVDERLFTWLRSNFWVRPGSAALEISQRVAFRWELETKPNEFDPDFPRRNKYWWMRFLFHDQSENEWLRDIPPCDIAATGQRFFEELVFRIIQNIVSATGITSVALSGGAFQNVVMNAKLQRMENLSIHVPVAPHDAGLALGGALLKAFKLNGYRSCGLSAHLGPTYSSIEITEALDSLHLSYRQPSELLSKVVDELTAGNVVGWFQGRAEFGARALGARSVIADPRDSTAKNRVNLSLKKRNWFMPYAPSILEEHGSEFFADFAPSPYMNSAFTIRPEKRDLIPSAVHIDNTCRVHSVNRKTNPLYHSLIEEFHRRTGLPLLLNTSFNRHGTPIVNTPRQAAQQLIEGNVDCLAIGEMLVSGSSGTRPTDLLSDRTNFEIDLLCFAAKLVQRDRINQAQTLLNRLGRVSESTGNGISICGELIWRRDEDVSVMGPRWRCQARELRTRSAGATDCTGAMTAEIKGDRE